ncbi:hypothetical protein Tco_1554376 [Tanacetum coccineum]
MKVIKKEPKFLWMFQIEYDLFTCDTPLGMNDDMFTYEVGIPGLSYPPHGIYAEPGIFVNKRLVRLMDVTIEEWLDLMYGDHKIFDRKIKEEVISKWLIQSYKKQFNEYMEIKKQRMTYGVAADMEYDLSDVDFTEWIALKFSNHLTMDWYTKNALWMYWIRGDDVEVLTDKELSDLKETYVNEEDEIAKIFRIKTNIFHFETPVCKSFNEFNYLLKINTDLLTHDIPGFKIYKEYKNAWIHE